METDFLASGNYYLPFSQAAVNCYQWKQSILYYFDQRKRIFCLALFRDFFCQWKLFLKSGKSQFLKIYSCQQTSISLLLSEIFKVEPDFPYSGNVFFQYPSGKCKQILYIVETVFFWTELSCFFYFLQRFVKVELRFSYKGTVFYNKSSIRLVETDFMSSGNSAF